MKRGNSAQAPSCPKEPRTLVKKGQFNLLLSYSVQLQHYEDFDTFSAWWAVFEVSIIHQTLTWATGSLTCVNVFRHAHTSWGPRFTVSSEEL